MTIDEAKEWLHKEVPTEILLERIYEEFKLELEAEYQRGWKDRHTQSDLESRSCKYWCKEKGCDLTYWQDYSHGYGFESEADDYCSKWEQK